MAKGRKRGKDEQPLRGRPADSQDEGDPSDAGFYESVGRAIRVFRATRAMERKDLADASGLSYAYISEIEKGLKQPSSRALLAIASALGIRPHELLETADRLPPPPRPDEPSAAVSWAGDPTDALRAQADESVGGEPRWFAASEQLRRYQVPLPEEGDRRRKLLSELQALSQQLDDRDVALLIEVGRRLRRR